jgi:RNA polymerase sigma-70 factor, ECF subfamily
MKSINDLSVELTALFCAGQAGNAKSYASFLEKTTPILRGMVFKKLPNGDVEDIVQEILISIHKARHTFDGERPIMPWLFSIAKFRITDALRQIYASPQHQQAFVEIDEAIDLLEAQDHANHVYTTTQMQNEIELDAFLAGMSEREQAILSMLYIEEYTAKETGVRLNMKESAVKVAAHRAIKKMKGVFGL